MKFLFITLTVLSLYSCEDQSIQLSCSDSSCVDSDNSNSALLNLSATEYRENFALSDRSEHTATALSDGTIIFIGGNDSKGRTLKSVEIFNPVTNKWKTVTPMSVSRHSHTATLLSDGSILVVGGEINNRHYDEVQSLDTIELYDPITDIWSTKFPLSYESANHTATLLSDGRILIAGGYNDNNAESYPTIELYNPTTGLSTEGPIMSSQRHGHSSTLLNDGRVLIVGGDGTTATEIFDPILETLSAGPNLNISVSNNQSLLMGNGNVLIFSGVNIQLFDPLLNTFTTMRSHSSPIHTVTLLDDERVLIVGRNIVEIYDSIDDSLVVVNSLNTPRSNHSVTVMNDGDILVFGGGSSLHEIYSITNDEWKISVNEFTQRQDSQSVLLEDGRLLVVGGYGVNTNDKLNTVEVFDTTTGQWSIGVSMLEPRHRHTLTLLSDGRVLAIGGASNNKNEVFNPSTNSWSYISGMTYSRLEHEATLLDDGTVFISGGSNNRAAEIYNPQSDTWLITPEMSVVRKNHTATLLNDGTVLLVAGISTPTSVSEYYAEDDDTAINSSSEIYDPINNSWSMTASIPKTLFAHRATQLEDGNVLITGGVDGLNDSERYFSNRAYMYDTSTGTWTTQANMSNSIADHTSTLLDDGRIMVTGGYFSGEFGDIDHEAGIQIFDPALNSWSTSESLVDGRYNHSVIKLNNGQVMVTGGNYVRGNERGFWEVISY